MSWLIANANGNFSASTTWGVAEAGSGSVLMVPANSVTVNAAATGNGLTFTIGNGDVIDGVVLWMAQLSTPPNGTFQVALQKSGVTQASVTVNKADLPPPSVNGRFACHPVFFKFTSTATGDGTANWRISITTTGTTTCTIATNAALTDYMHLLRTTTAAAPAAGNDLMICGELTGAGTNTPRTVTMDNTSTTAFGSGTIWSGSVAISGIVIGAYGTLQYGTAASTNYNLRVNGDVHACWNGTLDIGVAGGSEIPRTSTAVFELQMNAASGDFGLAALNGSTVNIAGLSRTSLKNVVKTKLTSDAVGSGGLINGGSPTNGTITGTGPDAGPTITAVAFVDNVTGGNHYVVGTGSSSTPANTTVVVTVWLGRGTGTNNRFVRAEVGNSTTLSSVTNGFFVDIDLQAGTVGTATSVGSGSATSATITACGTGYVVRLTGKVNTGSSSITSPFLIACNASGVVSYAGDTTNNFNYSHWQIVQVASISDTTLNVVDDTGWLSGDTIIVASTTRTVADCEDFTLNANAGASSMVTPQYPFGYSGNNTGNVAGGTHSGTSPTQAEVGLLTRNVKIRSTSNSLWSYVLFEALATATVSWAEFYYLGANLTNKHGVEVLAGATTNAKSITFSSMHDVFVGLYTASGANTSLNVTYSNNVIWNTTSQGVIILSAITNTDWTFDSNLVMKAGANGFLLGDIGGTLTNNTAVAAGSASYGFQLAESTSSWASLGTFNNNTAHSCGAHGFGIVSCSYLVGTISNSTSWRNTGQGILFNNTGATSQLYFNTVTVFGNSGSNINLAAVTTLVDVLNISGGTIAGDASFSTSYGIYNQQAGNLVQFNISSVDFSGTTTGLAAHTLADIETTSAQPTYISGSANNCKFGAGSVAGIGNSDKSKWAAQAYIGFEKYNQTAGDHRCEMTYGQLKTDSTIYNNASPSMRMTPNNASNKLQSAPQGKGMLIPVSNGNTAAVSVYIYKSKTGDGAAYNGNQPRLIQRANPALGQNSDVVLATYSASTGSWNQLSANTSTATDDGAFEIIVDCDGTAGWVNVDDWAAA